MELFATTAAQLWLHTSAASKRFMEYLTGNRKRSAGRFYIRPFFQNYRSCLFREVECWFGWLVGCFRRVADGIIYGIFDVNRKPRQSG